MVNRDGERGERDGQPLSVGDDERVWDDREMRVFGEAQWVEGWNAALDAVDGRRRERGGRRGVGVGGEGDDLRRLVGERFATALEGVWTASLRYLRSTVRDENGGLGSRVGRNGFRAANGLTDRRLVMRGARGPGGVGVGGGREGGLVVDEAALAFKQGIDRKLRKLTREMEWWLENRSSRREENPLRRCPKCRRFAEETWKFCAWDGARLEER